MALLDKAGNTLAESLMTVPAQQSPTRHDMHMHIGAIYDRGRLAFQRAITLKHQRLSVRIEIPDQEVVEAATPPTLRAYDLPDFASDIRERIEHMAALAEQARRDPLPETSGAESEEQRQRWAAVELRNTSRAEQARMP